MRIKMTKVMSHLGMFSEALSISKTNFKILPNEIKNLIQMAKIYKKINQHEMGMAYIIKNN